MRIIYLLFITFSLLNADQETYSKSYWKRLLHFGNSKSNIISDEFFLSNSSNPTLKSELKSMIELLEGENGKEIACNFPARYLWIKEELNVPNYNLESCGELNQFLDSLQNESIYLIYSSEYPNSPSSSFGHTMIAFKNNSIPLELADVIHFAAKTDKDDFLTYSYKGLTGKYNSHFMRTTLFQKIYLYNVKEQRYIYAYKLDFSRDEIKKIQYHLFELRKATFGYYFLNENCASKIVDLLGILNENSIAKQKIFHLPIDTIKTYKNDIKEVVKFIPLISKINYLMKKMSKEEKKEFLNITKENSTPTDNLSDITKEILVYYYQFLFRKYHQSYSNYDDVMKLVYNKTKIDDGLQNPLKNTQPSKIGISYSNESLEFNYMPLFLDYMDIQRNPMQEIEFKFLNINLSLQNQDLEIENIDLLDIKSLPTQYSFYHPISWSLYCGLNRENYSNQLKFQNSYGFGLTKEFGLNVTTSFLLNTGFDISKDNFAGYLSPSFLASTYPFDDFKIGIKSQYKYYFSKEYYENELFITKKLNSFNFSAGYVEESFNKKYFIGLSYRY